MKVGSPVKKMTALVIGVTGQDGGELARYLLEKEYKVYGVSRRVLPEKDDYVAGIVGDRPDLAEDLTLINGDVTDSQALEHLVLNILPNEIYNLAAQSDVGESFGRPIDTVRVNSEGVVKLLEILKTVDSGRNIRFYQASTSELFGFGGAEPQNEKTPFNPQNPYGISKHLAHLMGVHYRDLYGVQVSNGITFNHEGPNRGQNFVTRKITRSVAAIHRGLEEKLVLGNLASMRDWGHVRDYVEGMWLMLQHPVADDFVLATGIVHSVRDFATQAFLEAEIELAWEGEGVEEVGRDTKSGTIRVCVSPEFFRPELPGLLVGDASKARDVLGWKPKITFEEMVSEMVAADIARLERSL
jgi:GDPmannose 4,6-dehydratase